MMGCIFHKNNINLMAVNNEYSNIATIYSDRRKNNRQQMTKFEHQCMLMVFQFLKLKKSMAGGKSKDSF